MKKWRVIAEELYWHDVDGPSGQVAVMKLEVTRVDGGWGVSCRSDGWCDSQQQWREEVLTPSRCLGYRGGLKGRESVNALSQLVSWTVQVRQVKAISFTRWRKFHKLAVTVFGPHGGICYYEVVYLHTKQIWSNISVFWPPVELKSNILSFFAQVLVFKSKWT